MSAAYAPREGSVAAKVIAFLAANPQRKLTKENIADKFGCASVSVSTLMRPLIDAGMVATEKTGNAYVYSHPEPTEPEQPGDGKLQIASWSDGDVLVKGHTENQNGSITLSRDQLQQLIAHVTTPHIALPGDRLQHAAGA
jgi:predicted transcriptional regulator